MCVRTQLAPSWQTLQVGEASRISRGSPERVLNSDRSCPMSRRLVSCRGPLEVTVDVELTVLTWLVCCDWACEWWPLPQPAAARSKRTAAVADASRVIAVLGPVGYRGGVAARGCSAAP